MKDTVTSNISEKAARETLGIKDDDWIVTVNDEELELMKAALRTHASAAERLATKIEKIG